MPYIIKVVANNGELFYLKRTSHFGRYYGNMVLTNDREDARRYTRDKDAEYKGRDILYCMHAYDFNQRKYPKLVGITGESIIIEKL